MAASRHRTFRMGDELITEGVESRKAYLILEGEVEVRVGTRTPNPKTIARLGKGEVIGELSMLDDDTPTATVVALGETKVSILTRKDFQSRLETLDPVMKGVLTVLIRRIRALLAEQTSDQQTTDWSNWKK